MFQYQSPPTNPLALFLESSAQTLDLAEAKTIPPADCAAYTRNAEQRNFCADVCDRVHRIAFAFDRLCELTDVSWRTTAERKQMMDEDGKLELSPEMVEADGRWLVETDLLTFYIYYELKSVVDMLSHWRIAPASGSELEYALKARDRFLAHAEICRVSPRFSRGGVLPSKGFPHIEIASLQQGDPVTQKQYLDELGITGPIDRNAEVRRNNGILLSRQRNEKLTVGEVLRIKAFGVREPNLEKAIHELAAILGAAALPKIVSICDDAIINFGFERVASGGTTFLYRL